MIQSVLYSGGFNEQGPWLPRIYSLSAAQSTWSSHADVSFDGSLNVGLPAAIFGGYLIDILSDILGVNILSSQGDALYTAITESAMKKPPSYPGTSTKANTLAGKCGLEAVSTVTYEQQVKYDETSKEIEGAIAVADDADAGLDDSEDATGMKSGNFRTYKKN